MSKLVIGCVIRVHRSLGPGFREKVYQRALVVEFANAGLTVEFEKEIAIFYCGNKVGTHRLDLVVEGQLLLELKTVKEITPVHYAQTRSYLKASGLPLGLLINFSLERTDIRRLTAKRPLSEHEPPPPLPNSSPPHRRERQEISLPRG